MNRVTREVPNCAIVASIRTFDLQQSFELQRLFFDSELTVSAREFEEIVVHPFTDADLAEVSTQMPKLAGLLVKASGEFRELLRNPFNLHLAAHLLELNVPLEELSAVQSQVQLLGSYWRVRVERPDDGQDRRVLLRGIVRNMVDRNALSVPEESAYAVGLSNAFRALQSEELLRRSATDRISFSHNVVFDYAVARLLLDEESIAGFINEEPSRTIFFRPSLSLFFHHVWIADRSLFWKVAFQFLGSASLPERAQVVLAVAVYEASRTLDDLSPLFAESSDRTRRGITALLRAVQAFGGLQSRRRDLWLGVLDKLSSFLSLDFINEYVALVSAASEGLSLGDEMRLGGVGRRLLQWMWDQGPGLPEHRAVELSEVAASRVFPVIFRFYGSDVEATRRLVNGALDRLGQRTSSPHEAFRLAHEIKPIIQHDPAVAVEVYRRLFRHQELSQDKTVLGGPVFQFRSTRQQDFSLALYQLEVGFKVYLEYAPAEAALAAVESVNAEIDRERPAALDSDNAETFRFQYARMDLQYKADHSEIWDRGGQDYLSLQILDSAFNCAAKIISSEKDGGLGWLMLRTIASKATYAVVWKRLLEASALNCRAFYPYVFELLTVPEFVSAPETTIAAGNVLKAAYTEGLVGNADSLAIESSLALISLTNIIKRYEKPDSIRNRLLMCIPPMLIKSEELRTLSNKLIETNSARENKPFHQVSFGVLSEEESLRMEGIEPEAPENAKILRALKPLESFERRYVNGVPKAEECALMEPYLLEVSSLLSDSSLQDTIAERARGTLCACAEAIVKNSELSNEDGLVEFCRRILLAGASDPSPRFNPEYHLPFESPSWGSPMPRIEAAQGLAHLLWNWGPDAEVVFSLDQLSRDQVPAVRFQVVNGLLGFYKHGAKDKFWALVEQITSCEETVGVLLALLSTLGRVVGSEPKRVGEVLSVLVRRDVLMGEHRGDLTSNLLDMLTWLYVQQDDTAANKQLVAFEADPLKFHKVLGQEVFVAARYLASDQTAEARQRARNIFERILISVYQALSTLDPNASEAYAEAFRDLLHVIHEVALRLFFVLGVDPQLTGGSAGLTDAFRRELYFEVKPLIELLTLRPSFPGRHYLAAPSGHYLMQTLNGVLSYDPADVVIFASAVCRASSALNFQFDPMATTETVKLVERVLADHKEILRDAATANALGEILDIFVKAGWPEAVRLAFRIDEAVR